MVLASENSGESGECACVRVWRKLGAALDHLLLFVLEQTQSNAIPFRQDAVH